MAPIVVQGVKDIAPGDTPPRLEINELKKDKKFWSLYVQALLNLRDGPKNGKGELDKNWYKHPLSYFQISGIHGLPLSPWDQATPEKDDLYCKHHEPLFPTWHRAYSLLVEQALQQEAMSIASKYTVDKQDWVEAASKLRLPYWDFALPKGNMLPEEFCLLDSKDLKPGQLEEAQAKVAKITVTTKDGEKALDNPFLFYKYPDFSEATEKEIDQLTRKTLTKTTVRSSNLGDATNHENRRKNTLKAITQLRTWAQFSTDQARDEKGIPTNSLEAIHNGVHNALGGSMRSQLTAAFEPIFHLLHSQVDRMLALWSVLHPGVWADPEDASTLLDPFRDTPTSIWKSTGLEDIRNFNYSYPELDGLDLDHPRAKEWLTKELHRIYANGPPSGPKPRKVEGAALFADEPEPTAPVAKEIPPTDTWTVRIRCKPYEAGGSFSVLVFVGNEANLSVDPNEWLSSPNFTGAFGIFANDQPETCQNCVNHLENEVQVEGYVDLDGALEDAVKSLKADVVKPYLKDNIYWRAIKRENGTTKPVAPPSLEVVVRQDVYSKPAGELDHIFAEPTFYREWTGRSYEV